MLKETKRSDEKTLSLYFEEGEGEKGREKEREREGVRAG